MKYRFRWLGLALLTLLLSGLVSAQDNGNGNRGRNNDLGVLPNGNLDPSYTQRFPSEGSTIVSNHGRNGEITTMAGSCNFINFKRRTWLHLANNILYNSVYSNARSSTSDTYPCDIARIGARSRLWVQNFIQFDTSMLSSYNSADKTAEGTTINFNCSTPNKLARGNHEFVWLSSTYTYTTETTTCN